MRTSIVSGSGKTLGQQASRERLLNQLRDVLIGRLAVQRHAAQVRLPPQFVHEVELFCSTTICIIA